MAGEFTTKYWIIVGVLALVLLIGTGALSVYICKIYDTEKTVMLPAGVSPFPDVVPRVDPPTTDPTVNNCYKWCGTTTCPHVKQQACTTNLECQLNCDVPNAVTLPPVCKDGFCSPPMQTCISGFPKPTANPSSLKACITDTDCNVCNDTAKLPTGESMSCVFVAADSSLTLDGSLIEGIPGGYYCLPQRTGCDAHGGKAVWSDQGWKCECNFPTVMTGNECNTLVACNYDSVRDDSKALQQLLVNCNDPSNPFCGKPWVPESGIDPTGIYDKLKGFGIPPDAFTKEENKVPNCVCQCDGTDKVTNKGYTYDIYNSLTCVLDPCSTGAWGRTLLGDPGYDLNAIPGVVYSFFDTINTKFLSLTSNNVLTSTATMVNKFQMLPLGAIQSMAINGNNYVGVAFLATNADGSIVADMDNFGGNLKPGDDAMTWVLKKIPGYPSRSDNLDNLWLYNPTWSRPAGSQFSDPIYNDEKRYLVYSSGSYKLGTPNDAMVVLQRLDSETIDGDTSLEYINQPLTNCACSGANSVSSAPACFDSNDKFVNFVSLMSDTDMSVCDPTYSRNMSTVCDPYTIPNSVLTLQPTSESKMLCDLYKQDLSNLKSTQVLPTSTNLLPFRSGFVPGLNKFINPLTGAEELRSVCNADPCTGKYGDPSYSLQNNSGFWDALHGKCACVISNTDQTNEDYYPFGLDDLAKTWNKSTCEVDSPPSVCICDHITNPVCAICQNSCQSGTTFCKPDTAYPCESKNIACGTDELTGGPKCVCLGNCIETPGTGNLCMAKIADGGICAGLEDQPGVCAGDGVTCQRKRITASTDNLLVHQCTDTPYQISYCSSQDSRYCWGSNVPNQTSGAPNACSPAYETCPIVNL